MGVECDNLTKIPGRCMPRANSTGAPEPASTMNWRRRAPQLQKEAHVFYLAFRHPCTPWYAKLIAGCTAGYLFSPIQLIPSFIPVIGFLDDLLVLFLGAQLLRSIIPPDVLTECRQVAAAAELSRKQQTRSPVSIVAAAVIATVWLLSPVAASGIMTAYFFH